MTEWMTSHLFQEARVAAFCSGVAVPKHRPSTCLSAGFGVSMVTTMASTTQKRTIHTQNAYTFSSLKMKVKTLCACGLMIIVIRRVKPSTRPTMRVHIPAFGEVFFQQIPSRNTAAMAGASRLWTLWM